MKKQIILQLFLSLTLVAGSSVARTPHKYTKQWKEVTQLQAEGLPRSVALKCDEIFLAAQKEGNFPQQLRAFITRLEARKEIDKDSLPVDLTRLNNWRLSTSSELQRCVLSGVLAQLRVNEYPRASFRKSTSPIENDKLQATIDTLLKASLSQPEYLSQQTSDSYESIILQGHASRYFAHDLLHLSGLSVLNTLSELKNRGILSREKCDEESQNIYQSLIQFYTKKSLRSAALLIQMQQLQYERDLGQLTATEQQQALTKLIIASSDLEVCAELCLAHAQLLREANKQTEALKILQAAIASYPHYDRIGALKNLQEEILQPMLNVQLTQVTYPGQKLAMQVQYKNLEGFTIRRHKLPFSAKEIDSIGDPMTLLQKKQIFPKEEVHYSLHPTSNYMEEDTVFYLTGPEHGIYLNEIIPDKKAANKGGILLASTQLKLVWRDLKENQTEIIAFDQESGIPLQGVTISLYNATDSGLVFYQSLSTNAQGKCYFNKPTKNGRFSIFATYLQDKALPSSDRYFYPNDRFRDNEKPKAEEHIELFTDRALYRPGQKVSVKGIAYQQLGDSTHVVKEGKTYQLNLLDANQQEVGKVEEITNTFGSFTGEFTLPEKTLNGTFVVGCGELGKAFIQVESYKLPSFEIKIDSLLGTPQIGDSITLTGHAISLHQTPLIDAQVRYQVTRTSNRLYSYRASEEETIAQGNSLTNTKGSFEIPFRLSVPFTAISPQKGFGYRNIDYSYNIKIFVTDATGETQSEGFFVPEGHQSLMLASELSQELCTDTPLSTRFIAQNIIGKEVKTTIQVQLYAANDSIHPLWNKEIQSGKTIDLNEWHSLPGGTFKLSLTAHDEQNRLCTNTESITLYSQYDTHSPVQGTLWIKQLTTSPKEGQSTEILVGTTKKNLHLLVDIFCKGKSLESRIISLSDTLCRLNFPYKPEYGDGATASLCTVKEGEVENVNIQLPKPEPKKELTLQWEVFRDRLQPGQKEEWKLSIQRPASKDSTNSVVPCADAELLAMLYDASLDLLRPYQPRLKVNFPRYISYINSISSTNNTLFASLDFPLKEQGEYPYSLEYDRWLLNKELILSVADVQGNDMRVRGGGKMLKTSLVAEALPMSAMNNETSLSTKSERFSPTETIRTNFSEAGFFLPQLRTNAKGEVRIAFTIPESLTRWHFIGIAHTPTMETGILESDLITRKPFMLSSALPRYLRENDITTVSCRIHHASNEKEAQGIVRCEVFNVATNEVLWQEKVPFAVPNDSSIAVHFKLDLRSGSALSKKCQAQTVLGIRMTAQSKPIKASANLQQGNSAANLLIFSDGEQHTLAVLSSREHLVESVPLTLRGKARQFSLTSLFNGQSPSAQRNSLTVELTPNPAWMAVEALPYLNNPTQEDAFSWAAAYYSNTLSEWIVCQNPLLKEALIKVSQKEAESNQPNSGISNLRKNEELKSLLLEETPWVAEAKTEEAQMQKLATLVDSTQIAQQTQLALTKLSQLQLPNGGFAWYKDMDANLQTTAYVLETLSRLPLLTQEVQPATADTLRRKAMRYLQKEYTQRYTTLKKQKALQNYLLTHDEVAYLYLRSLNKETLNATDKEAQTFYLHSLEASLSSLSVDDRAKGVVILKIEQEAEAATRFEKSLRELAVESKDMGTFYASSTHTSWSSHPICLLTQAAEAFQQMGDSATVEGLKINLLRHKQVQLWGTTPANTNALYFLLKGKELLTAPSTGAATVTLAGHTLKVEAHNDAVGTQKFVFTDAAALNARSATLSQTGNGLIWGAVYSSCDEAIDALKAQGENIKVEKKLYIKRSPADTLSKVNWIPVTKETLLHKGDQIRTQLIVTADRDLDFITLKDARAACLEPVDALSNYLRNAYVTHKDASSILFFDRLRKGTHLFELDSYVVRSGNYTSGAAFLQSTYSAEFAAHSGATTLRVE